MKLQWSPLTSDFSSRSEALRLPSHMHFLEQCWNHYENLGALLEEVTLGKHFAECGRMRVCGLPSQWYSGVCSCQCQLSLWKNELLRHF